jgi:hypothetical protein
MLQKIQQTVDFIQSQTAIKPEVVILIVTGLLNYDN